MDTNKLKSLWLVENASQYLKKGPVSLDKSLPMHISEPLLKHFIQTANHSIQSKSYYSSFRFAHAETLIPFAALLGIPQASFSTCVPDSIFPHWNDYDISPMSGNIVMLFCEDDHHNINVLVMLNEQPVTFPIETENKHFYAWKDLEAFFIERLIMK